MGPATVAWLYLYYETMNRLLYVPKSKYSDINLSVEIRESQFLESRARRYTSLLAQIGIACKD